MFLLWDGHGFLYDSYNIMYLPTSNGEVVHLCVLNSGVRMVIDGGREIDSGPHLGTNFLDAFSLTFCVGHHHMDATVVLVGVMVVVDVMVVGDAVCGLGGAVFVVAFHLESVDGPSGILTP